MSKLFISYSHHERLIALALRDWLEANGWRDEVFVDIDPEHGISGGERWRDALRRAAARCEAVIFLLSPSWLKSKACWSEFVLAQKYSKAIIQIKIDHLLAYDELPSELSEYQIIDRFHSSEEEFEIRLLRALQDAGTGPSTFSLPQDGIPYRGLATLTERDAALFFGRDAEVLAALDTLREIRETGLRRTMVILGASGSGKSSLLRAGIWPRLNRNDRQFLALPVIRPARGALTGPNGLWQGLAEAINDPRRSHFVGKGIPRTKGAIADQVKAGNSTLHGIVQAITEATKKSFVSGQNHEVTCVLCIDQGEELLNSEGREESDQLLGYLQQINAEDPNFITVIAVRSDVYSKLQTDPRFLPSSLRPFNLSPMSKAAMTGVVCGPANSVGLEVDPKLTAELLRSAEGADALPLLAFTLERLYSDRSHQSRLDLDDYNKIGGAAGLVNRAIEDVRRRAVETGADPAHLDSALRRIFLPKLARVNEAGEFARRIAFFAEFDAELHKLLELLVELRLLVADDLSGDRTIEIAHEALLREWPPLADWLRGERAFLEWREQVVRSRALYEANKGDLLSGRALAIAEQFLGPYEAELNDSEKQFVKLSIERKEAEQKTELNTARKSAKRARIFAFSMLALVVALVAIGLQLFRIQGRANLAQRETESRQLAAVSSQIDDQLGSDKALAIAWLALPHDSKLQARPITNEASAAIYHRNFAPALEIEDGVQTIVSPDGRNAITITGSDHAFLWKTDTFELTKLDDIYDFRYRSGDNLASEVGNHSNSPVRFTADSSFVAMIDRDGSKYKTYDLKVQTYKQEIPIPSASQVGGTFFRDMVISADGSRMLLITDNCHLLVFDTNRGSLAASIPSTVFDSDSVGCEASSDSETQISNSGRYAAIFRPVRDEWKYGEIVVFDLQKKAVKAAFYASSDVQFKFNLSERFLLVREWAGESRASLINLQTKEQMTVQECDGGYNNCSIEFDFAESGFKFRDSAVVDVIESSASVKLGERPDGFVGSYAASEPFPSVWRISPEKLSAILDQDLLDGDRQFDVSPAGNTALVDDPETACPRVFDLRLGRLIGTIVADQLDCGSVEFLAEDGSWAIVEMIDSVQRKNWKVVYRIRPESPSIVADDAATSTASATSAEHIIVGSEDNSVNIFEVSERSKVPAKSTNAPISALRGESSGNWVATGDWRGAVQLIHVGNGRKVPKRLPNHKAGISALAFSSDGKLIASGAHDATVFLSRISADVDPIELKGHLATISTMDFSRNGTLLASASFDGTARIWTADGRLKATVQHDGAVFSAKFHPTLDVLATGAEDAVVRIVSVNGATNIIEGLGHTDIVRGVEWRDDGESLLSWSDDLTARLWSRSGKRLLTLSGHRRSLTHGRFTADKRIIMTADRTGQVRLWDTETGALLATRQAGNASVKELSFAEDRRVLTVSSADGSIYQWWIAPGGLRERIADVGALVKNLRPLSRKECISYGLVDLEGAGDVCRDISQESSSGVAKGTLQPSNRKWSAPVNIREWVAKIGAVVKDLRPTISTDCNRHNRERGTECVEQIGRKSVGAIKHSDPSGDMAPSPAVDAYITGSHSIVSSEQIIKEIKKYNELNKFDYKVIQVGGRRWDLLLERRIVVKLSEYDFAGAIESLAAMQRKQNILDPNRIEYIDLRDPERVIIRRRDLENVKAEP